jgi:biopolymer transport protein ExbD
MADPKKFFFDVWLSQSKTVYRDVPYEVVTDWLQQGRLLGDDRIRPAGTEQWFQIAEVPAFAGFIPKADPLRTDEKAEALEPLEMGFAWGKQEEQEDADPDMIPLIDVSLVLLIFFMITSTVAAVSSTIKVPEVTHVQDITGITANTKFIWIGIEYYGNDVPARYIVRLEGDKHQKLAELNLNEEQAIKKVEEVLENQTMPEVRIAAHKQVNFDLLKELALKLDKHKAKGKVNSIKIEVGEKK